MAETTLNAVTPTTETKQQAPEIALLENILGQLDAELQRIDGEIGERKNDIEGLRQTLKQNIEALSVNVAAYEKERIQLKEVNYNSLYSSFAQIVRIAGILIPSNFGIVEQNQHLQRLLFDVGKLLDNEELNKLVPEQEPVFTGSASKVESLITSYKKNKELKNTGMTIVANIKEGIDNIINIAKEMRDLLERRKKVSDIKDRLLGNKKIIERVADVATLAETATSEMEGVIRDIRDQVDILIGMLRKLERTAIDGVHKADKETGDARTHNIKRREREKKELMCLLKTELPKALADGNFTAVLESINYIENNGSGLAHSRLGGKTLRAGVTAATDDALRILRAVEANLSPVSPRVAPATEATETPATTEAPAQPTVPATETPAAQAVASAPAAAPAAPEAPVPAAEVEDLSGHAVQDVEEGDVE